MDDLQRWIDEHLAGRRVAVLGVGNRLRGDDGAGPVLAERLRARGHAGVLDAGSVPENFLGVLGALEADVVLFVDALEHGAEPGSCAVVEPDALAARDGGTHAPSLALLAGVLESFGTRCWLLGVQPGAPRFGDGLSAPIDQAVDALVRALDDVLAREVSHA